MKQLILYHISPNYFILPCNKAVVQLPRKGLIYLCYLHKDSEGEEMMASNGRPATASTVDVDNVDVSADKDGVNEGEKDKKKEEPQKMVGNLEIVSI